VEQEPLTMAKRYWLMKSDPETFGLAELKASPERTTRWDGVRNYQARNLLRDEVRTGDEVLFYHSQSKPPAVVATAKVTRAGYPDPTQFDRRSTYYDADSPASDPRWYAVDIQLVRELARPVSLSELRAAAGLRDMVLLRRGSRLSVQPVTVAEWKIVMKLAASSRPGAARRA
jgi:predicted RNA-binding protein with PUA-like domain